MFIKSGKLGQLFYPHPVLIKFVFIKVDIVDN